MRQLQNSAPPPAQRLEAFDSIRGIAATVVVLHHCLLVNPDFCAFFFDWNKNGRHFSPNGPLEFLLFETPARIIWAGFEAVTLFFVLSGFVLALPWLKGAAPKYNDYITRRLMRLYIPYIVAIGIAVVLSWRLHITHPIADVSYWVTQWNWAQPVTTNVLVDHVLMAGHENNLDGVVHSLVWEVRVSIIFPIFMFFICRYRLMGVVISMLLIGAAYFGLELLRRRIPGGSIADVAWDCEKTLFYAHHFIVGAALALRMEWLKRLGMRAPWAAIAALLAGLIMAQMRWSTNPAVQATLVGIGAALILVAAIMSQSLEKALVNPLFQWLGKISYSLYLIHVPIIFTSIILLHDKLPLFVIVAGAGLISFPLGQLFDWTISRPAVTLGRRLSRLLWSGKPAAIAN